MKYRFFIRPLIASFVLFCIAISASFVAATNSFIFIFMSIITVTLVGAFRYWAWQDRDAIRAHPKLRSLLVCVIGAMAGVIVYVTLTVTNISDGFALFWAFIYAVLLGASAVKIPELETEMKKRKRIMFFATRPSSASAAPAADPSRTTGSS